MSLCEPAQNGDTDRVEKVAPQFMQHAVSMQKVCKVIARCGALSLPDNFILVAVDWHRVTEFPSILY